MTGSSPKSGLTCKGRLTWERGSTGRRLTWEQAYLGGGLPGRGAHTGGAHLGGGITWEGGLTREGAYLGGGAHPKPSVHLPHPPGSSRLDNPIPCQAAQSCCPGLPPCSLLSLPHGAGMFPTTISLTVPREAP